MAEQPCFGSGVGAELGLRLVDDVIIPIVPGISLGDDEKRFKDLSLEGDSLKLGDQNLSEETGSGDEGFGIVGSLHIEEYGDGIAGNICLHEGTEPIINESGIGHRIWVDENHNIHWQDHLGGSRIIHTEDGEITCANIYVNPGGSIVYDPGEESYVDLLTVDVETDAIFRFLVNADMWSTNRNLNISSGAYGSGNEFLNLADGFGNVGIWTINGTPESNITAGKGSIAFDTTNGEGYLKTTNSVNTGWKKILKEGGDIVCGTIQVTEGSVEIDNNQFYRARRDYNDSMVDVLGFPTGSDWLQIRGGTSSGGGGVNIQKSSGVAIASFRGDGKIAFGGQTPVVDLHMRASQIVIDSSSYPFATSKYNSQGVAWSATQPKRTPSLIFNSLAQDRPEISWYRGSRNHPGFSIRMHTENDKGGEFWSGGGTAVPKLTMVMKGGRIGAGEDVTIPVYPFDIVGDTDQLQIRLANNIDDVTAKTGGFCGRHYTNSEEEVACLIVNSSGSWNRMYYGGGSNAFNAATKHSFYTAPNITTVMGTERFTINESGIAVNGNVTVSGDLEHEGSKVGFYEITPVAQQTGVAITAIAIHAALVNLGLFTA